MAYSSLLRFHEECSKSIYLTPLKTLAKRNNEDDDFNGFCFSNRPVEPYEHVHLQCLGIKTRDYQTGIHIGFISFDPRTISASTLPRDIGPEAFHIIGYATKPIPYERLVEIYFYFKPNGDVMLGVDSEETLFFHMNKITEKLWALIDIECRGFVRILGKHRGWVYYRCNNYVDKEKMLTKKLA